MFDHAIDRMLGAGRQGGVGPGGAAAAALHASTEIISEQEQEVVQL
jgi:hypothetical protein